MRAVTINVINHSQQRYCTAGDWQYEGAGLKICVSDIGSWEMNMLVSFHELAEAILCKARGIGAEAVDAFDMEFERKRQDFDERGLPVTGEPGDHPDAPYRREHFFATTVERLLAAELGVDWAEYEERLASL